MEFRLERPFIHYGKKCWIAKAPTDGDSVTAQNSNLRLFEDGQRIVPPHALHEAIANGTGFSHWGKQVYFCASDGSDPNTNGREYIAKIRETHRTPREIRETDEPVTLDLIEEYIAAVVMAPPNSERCHQARRFSMLHSEALAIHELFGAKSHGRIVEIGPYVGASTVCLASHSKMPVISIEAGGRYAHDALPSHDIITDLRNNLHRYGLTERVKIVPSNTHFPETIEWARHLAAPTIGVLVIDADGNVGRDFNGFADLLAPDCLLIIDDYSTDTVKSPFVKPGVDLMVADGLLTEFGIFGWGTWVGRVRRRSAAA